jgi:hypothetical protein
MATPLVETALAPSTTSCVVAATVFAPTIGVTLTSASLAVIAILSVARGCGTVNCAPRSVNVT